MSGTTEQRATIKAFDRRRNPRRVAIAHQIEVRGLSATGDAFAEQTRTVNVSERGCCFEVARTLVPGDIVSIKVRRANGGPYAFRVIWTSWRINHWVVGAILTETGDVWDMIFPPRSP
jgi:hypothetical protein